MKKNLALFIAALLCVSVNAATAAVSIKKAAPVATKETNASSTTGSLVPSVLTLVSDVQALNAKQRELDAECIPSSAEIEFVNNTIKEWAKTGSATWEDVSKRLGRAPCEDGTCYEATVKYSAGNGLGDVKYDNFATKSDELMVWYKFPKASKGQYCPDGSLNCSDREKKTVSNIYEIFDLVDFGVGDYTKRDNLTMAAKLLDRSERCSDVKISQKKKQMWGEFLVGTMGNVGQKTNTATIMQTVGNITKNGASLNGGLSSLGAIATQFMDK